MKALKFILCGTLLLLFDCRCLADLSSNNVLDKPIHVTSCLGLYNQNRELKKNMDPMDWDFLNQAVSHLIVSINTEIAQGATQAQQDSIVSALTSGMTPRQIIVLGFTLELGQAEKAELKEELKMEHESSASGNKQPMEAQSWRQQLLSDKKNAVNAIMKYSAK
jgi:hypothetical protein